MNIQNLLEINNLSSMKMNSDEDKESALIRACSFLRNIRNLKIVVTTAGLFVSEINSKVCELPVFVELPNNYLKNLAEQIKIEPEYIVDIQTTLLFLQNNSDFFQKANTAQTQVVAMYEYLKDSSGRSKLFKYNIGNY